MKKETKQERIIKYLIEKGCVEIESKSYKYRTLKRPDKENWLFFVGKNGAVRTGKISSASVSITDRFKNI